MSWLYEARKCKDIIPSPEILENINLAAKKMTDFEKEYAHWVNALFKDGLRVHEITKQIKILAKYLTELKQHGPDDCIEPWKCKNVSDEELESCKPLSGHRWWDKTKRFTQLCALRAAIRGRLHFSPNSNHDTLTGYYGIAAPTLLAQKYWVDEFAHEFQWENKE